MVKIYLQPLQRKPFQLASDMLDRLPRNRPVYHYAVARNEDPASSSSPGQAVKPLRNLEEFERGPILSSYNTVSPIMYSNWAPVSLKR
ncbi:hypothetical protein PoB_006478000 [Plakobranchus ocellatus]|uniref:Uncharacterized protein n=1 Tax=Plakobranchus ocellatus TaxID=259542 RepID=A0AAV4D2E6_9GAST|nr:hypothetical protein PoB_006478000 [Plakobranchus ocellatus]